MSNIILALQSSGFFYPVVILVAVLALATIGYFVGKKLDLKVINSIRSIVEFIGRTLVNLEFKDEKINLVIQLIIQAITYTLAINTEESIDSKIEDSIIFIRNISNQFGEELSEAEYDIIRSVLRVAFIFISTLGINTSLKYDKLSRYAKQMKFKR